jgi:voltage-gated potassium channel
MRRRGGHNRNCDNSMTRPSLYGATDNIHSLSVDEELEPLELSKERKREFAFRRQSATRALAAMHPPRRTSAVLNTLFPETSNNKSYRKRTMTTATISTPPTNAPTAPQHKQKMHYNYSFWYTLLNPHSKQWQAVAFQHFIATVILLDVVMFIVSTDARVREPYNDWFTIAEGVVSTIFLTEYILRAAVCTEHPTYRHLHPMQARMRYLRTPAAVLDLVATAPFFVGRVTGVSNLPKLTSLRVVRLVRILRNSAVVRALDTVYRVIYYNAAILQVALLVCSILVLTTACMLYYLRPRSNSSSEVYLDELDEFHSIPATLYLSTLMLTGQGGPDANDLPWYTRAVVLLTAVFSVAMFAIPASMLTWGFEAGT